MPRVLKVGKSSLPGQLLDLSFPDDETLAFWKATADGPDELAARVARFSRALTKDVTAKAGKSRMRQRPATGTNERPTRPRVRGKLLIMPKPAN